VTASLRARFLPALLALALGGCTHTAQSAHFRSPSHDYPAPPRTTADGEVLGADRKPIADAIGSTRMPPPREGQKP
jgi:hypothetical protein